MGTTHTPMLVYNSQHARPKPLVVANVTLSNAVALPASVTACFAVTNEPGGCTTFAGGSWGAPGETRRVVVMGEDGAWTTDA